MRDGVDAFFRHQTALLQGGELDALAALIRVPIPIFHKDGLKLKATGAQIRQALQSIYDGIQSIGATQITYRILDMSDRPATGTITCLIGFQYRNEASEILRQTRIRYFLEPEGSSFCIAMLEYYEMGFAEVFDDFPTTKH